ncbi:hypothetical protein FHL15_006126 [Xylaria flabelliformis]|uniref:Uncharacterized protein n=1 Tax=Xylaria flabelliformis TaxID=2512241 RepID=A0A553HYG8_9PEZI|nr:hypothetical protein FHL15_006126 [Xylaria flabelliformis]
MSSETPLNNSPEQPTTFKERLDQVAREARQPTNGESNTPSLIEKVADYVPGASKLLGTEKNNQEQHEKKPPSKDPAIPPLRPDHDDHIAEFVREQHRSKKPDGSLGA